MKASAPIFLIIAAVVGFTSGSLIDGELSPHLPGVPNVSILNHFFDNNRVFSFIQSAELSLQGQAIIEHAFIDFTIDQIQVGEHFKNIVSECVFKSEESFGGDIFPDDSIDDGICIICKLEGECRDVNETFVELPHGTRLGAINSLLATDGIFLTVDARDGRPNTAIIFDGDTPGGSTDTASEPDPDLRADGNQGDANLLDGICSDCGGLHMIIIPENVNDVNADNLVDTPNDSAAGGTLKFQFAQSREIVSFVLVDMDRPSAAVHEARAYSDFSCTQLVSTKVFDPDGADGNVQTIDMENVVARCLKIEVHDSFGVTNLILECADWTGGGHILGVGRVNLDDGYTANEEIHIPIDGMVDVRVPKHVAIEILSAILNFQGLSHGDVLNDQFLGAYGIKISGSAWVGGNLVSRDPIVFDTELSGTRDFDLEVDIGNISIVQENTDDCETGTCSLPDDNAAGGIQKFQFNPKRYVNSLVWIDADRPEPFGTIFLYSDYACTNLIDQGTTNGGINIPFTGDKTTQVLVPVNVERVGCMIADYKDSGGLSRLNLGCPLPDDPITMPWFQGDPHVPSEKEPIWWLDFEDNWEPENWTVDYNHNPSGDIFQIVSETTIDAYDGSKVLAGSGYISEEAWWNRDSFDVSDYHNVMISIWYSYKSTEAADSFSFYYKDGSNWVEIFNVPDPAIGNGAQEPWQNAMVTIPDDVDFVELQMRWKSSQSSEYLMIDALHIDGIPN